MCAVAVEDAAGLHLITNEQAAKKYKARLNIFTDYAKTKPPTKPVSAGG